MTSKEVKVLLNNKYSPPQFAFFTEVANGTGARQSGYADGVAVGLWPSMGFPIWGFEIKVSRSDWLNELKQPWKAEQVMQYCNKWFLVAEKGVAKIEEIPKNWGFIEVVNGRLYTKKPAPELEDPKFDMAFCAALLRRATEHTIPKETLWAEVKKAEAEAKVEYQKRIDDAEANLKKYREQVEEWEKITGLKVLAGWYENTGQLARAVKYVLDGGFKIDWDIKNLVEHAEKIITEAKKAEQIAKEIKEIKIEK